MKRAFAIALTLAVVCGLSAGTVLLTDLVTSSSTGKVVAVLSGTVFGIFAIDIYRALMNALCAHGQQGMFNGRN